MCEARRDGRLRCCRQGSVLAYSARQHSESWPNSQPIQPTANPTGRRLPDPPCRAAREFREEEEGPTHALLISHRLASRMTRVSLISRIGRDWPRERIRTGSANGLTAYRLRPSISQPGACSLRSCHPPRPAISCSVPCPRYPSGDLSLHSCHREIAARTTLPLPSADGCRTLQRPTPPPCQAILSVPPGRRQAGPCPM